MHNLRTRENAQYFQFCPLNLFTKTNKNSEINISENPHLTKVVLILKQTSTLTEMSTFPNVHLSETWCGPRLEAKHTIRGCEVQNLYTTINVLAKVLWMLVQSLAE